MSKARRPAALARKVLPWVIGWMAFQAVVAVVGRVLALRRNEGDESSTSIERVLTHTGVELHPRNPELSRIRLDLAMAGGEIDLTGLPRPATGIDLTVNALMAGVAVRVPSDWRGGGGGPGGGGGGGPRPRQRAPPKPQH